MGTTTADMATKCKVDLSVVESRLRSMGWIDERNQLTNQGEINGLYCTKGSQGQSVIRIPTYLENKLEKRIMNTTKYASTDGHLLDSRAEWMIDEWLHQHHITHYVHQVLPFVADKQYAVCDFYLPEHDLYIEFWGLQDEAYLQRKRHKQAEYDRLGLKRCDLHDEDLHDLDYALSSLMNPREDSTCRSCYANDVQ